VGDVGARAPRAPQLIDPRRSLDDVHPVGVGSCSHAQESVARVHRERRVLVEGKARSPAVFPADHPVGFDHRGRYGISESLLVAARSSGLDRGEVLA